MEILRIQIPYTTSTHISPMNTCKPYRPWAMSARIMTRKTSISQGIELELVFIIFTSPETFKVCCGYRSLPQTNELNNNYRSPTWCLDPVAFVGEGKNKLYISWPHPPRLQWVKTAKFVAIVLSIFGYLANGMSIYTSPLTNKGTSFNHSPIVPTAILNT